MLIFFPKKGLICQPKYLSIWSLNMQNLMCEKGVQLDDITFVFLLLAAMQV
jgi:hypothetical protein